jgi:co-chaperonin GroES (HSP10)
MTAMLMAHDGDPKQKLLEEIGDLSEVELFNNQILVAVYVRPTKTKSGLYLTDKYAEEDKFQGKVGLLVGMGPAAFQDDSGQWFNNASFNLHDWLVYRPSDGWSITINGVLCRMLSDTQVKMRIPTPDTAW